jgi:iron complex outermembrane recepter protein
MRPNAKHSLDMPSLSRPLLRTSLLIALISTGHAQTAPPTTSTPDAREPTQRVTSSRLSMRQFFDLEVTGSSMIAGQSKQALPVIVISAKDIERSSATSLATLLQSLPQQFNGLDTGRLAAGLAQAGPESMALRGSAAGTLVLLNGRRLPRYSRATVATERSLIDLNVVPLQAIERIELLTEGSSTRYGSDAVAGVVNIITKAEYHHADAGVHLGAPLQGQGERTEAYFSLSGGDLEADAHDWQIHAALSDAHRLRAQDRQASASGWVQVPGAAPGVYFSNPAAVPYSWPATTVDSGGQATFVAPVNGQCAPGWLAVSTAGQATCRYNPAHDLDVYPALQKAQALGAMRWAINAKTTAFAELAVGQKRSVGAAVSPLIGAWAQPLSGGRTALVAPLPLGPGGYQFDDQFYRLSAGLKGQTAQWHYQLSAATGTNKAQGGEYGLGNKLATATAFADLGLSEAELGSAVVSPQTLALLRTGVRDSAIPLDQGQSTLHSLEAVASRVLRSTDDGDITLGVGASWLRETLWTAVYDGMAAPYTRDPSQPDLFTHRQVAAAHGELELPLSPFVTTGIHIRHDQYSDVGSVTTSKLTWRYQPERAWLWRASYGTGFRAPSMEQTSGTQPTLFAVGSDGITRFFGLANPDLKPERFGHLSLGVRYEPSANWSVGADYWRLHIRNGIQQLSKMDIDADPTLTARYVSANTEGGYDYTIQPLNLRERTQAGLDYDIQWRRPVAWGRLRTALKGTLYTQALVSSDARGEVSELGRTSGSAQYTPRHKLSLQLSLERPRWQTWVTLNYLSGNTEPYGIWDSNTDVLPGPFTALGTRTVAGYATLDAGWRYQPDTHHTWSVQVLNLADQAPPFRASAQSQFISGINTSYGDYRGRTLRVGYNYRFR